MSVSLSRRGPLKALHLIQKQGSSKPFITLANGSISSVRIPNVNNQVRHGTSMKVILLENVANRGSKGEVVPVKRGYARNLLIPRKLAAYATLENRAKFEEMITERRNKKESGIVEDGDTVKFNLALEVVLREVVESEVFAFVRATATDGSGLITEALTTADILSYLKSGGYEMPLESDIKIPEVTTVGLYPLSIGGVRTILHVIEAVVIKQDK